MAQIHESVANFLTALASGLEELLSEAGPEKASVSWTPRTEESSRADLTWWSCGLSVDPDCRFLAGAREETWAEIDRFATLTQAMQRAAQSRFGAEVSCTGTESSEEPPQGWTTVVVSVSLGARMCSPMEFVLNHELEVALGGQPGPSMTPDMLMHVEIPVSVLLGRTQMRMQDVLGLTHGSIVELDQDLSDEVEIRVSNCTIARGEVVAVDGNYGVRILRMLPSRNGTVAHSALSGKSAVYGEREA